MAENEKTFYDMSMFKKGETLQSSVLTVSGKIKSVNRKTSKQGNDYLRVEFEAVLGDKFVRENFGEDFVNSNHTVTFQFPLTGWRSEEFEKYPPRWGQFHICMLENMEPGSFTKKDGTKVCIVNCYGQVSALGSRKKPDGTDRAPVKIFGAGEKADDASEAPEPQVPSPELYDKNERDPF